MRVDEVVAGDIWQLALPASACSWTVYKAPRAARRTLLKFMAARRGGCVTTALQGHNT